MYVHIYRTLALHTITPADGASEWGTDTVESTCWPQKYTIWCSVLFVRKLRLDYAIYGDK